MKVKFRILKTVYPVIADVYMESFEKTALQAAPYKPSLYKHYVDDTFLIWPHRRDRLDEFVTAWHSVHGNIQFTVEVEKGGSLLFWTS